MTTVTNTPEQPVDSKYSLGTQAAVTAIQTQLAERSNSFDTIVVNVATLVRNRVRKELVSTEEDTAKIKQMKFNTLYKETLTEIGELTKELTETMQRLKIRNAAVMIYAPDYLRSIPKDALRTQTPPRQAQNDVLTRLAQQLLPAMTGTPKIINDVSVFQCAMISNVIPWKILARMITPIRSLHHLLLVSHQAIDFHLDMKFRDMKVVESYTGKLKSVKELGEKVFGQQNIPFIPLTHALLGDDSLIVSPLSVKEKKELYALAEQEAWKLKTTEYVRQSLMKHGFAAKIKINME